MSSRGSDLETSPAGQRPAQRRALTVGIEPGGREILAERRRRAEAREPLPGVGDRVSRAAGTEVPPRGRARRWQRAGRRTRARAEARPGARSKVRSPPGEPFPGRARSTWRPLSRPPQARLKQRAHGRVSTPAPVQPPGQPADVLVRPQDQPRPRQQRAFPKRLHDRELGAALALRIGALLGAGRSRTVGADSSRRTARAACRPSRWRCRHSEPRDRRARWRWPAPRSGLRPRCR